MTAELPRWPMSWPEPWRSMFEELRNERIAIMTESGTKEDSHAVTVAVRNIEQDLRARFARAVAEKENG